MVSSWDIWASLRVYRTEHEKQHNILIEYVKRGFSMNCGCHTEQKDFRPHPYAVNIEQTVVQNHHFRTAAWTGDYLQMTLMCIPACGEIGLEVHEDTDQLIRVEQGCAVVKMGKCKDRLDFCRTLCRGDAFFVPAGTWHNVINAGGGALKVSSVYAPPHHPRGTVQHTKADAERE